MVFVPSITVMSETLDSIENSNWNPAGGKYRNAISCGAGQIRVVHGSISSTQTQPNPHPIQPLYNEDAVMRQTANFHKAKLLLPNTRRVREWLSVFPIPPIPTIPIPEIYALWDLFPFPYYSRKLISIPPFPPTVKSLANQKISNHTMCIMYFAFTVTRNITFNCCKRNWIQE